MLTSVTPTDISRVLGIYCGGQAVIAGPNLQGVFTVSVPDGVLSQEELDFAVAEASKEVGATANRALLFAKAKTALINNEIFLQLTTPTTAQLTAQLKQLTRQVNALIKIEIQDLSDINNT